MERFFPLLRETYYEAVRGTSPEESVAGVLKKEKGRLFFKWQNEWVDITPGEGGELFIISTGKAAPGMYTGAVRVAGKPRRGIVATGECEDLLPGATIFRGGHPFPDKGSIGAAKAIGETMRGITENDSLLYLLSGGSSSMVALPAEGVSFKDKIDTIKAVMEAGASIEELNRVRKALSMVKGGKLAKLLKTERACILIVSDVPGNDLSVIGSGPLFPSPSPLCPRIVLEKLSILELIPPSVLSFLEGRIDDDTGPQGGEIPHVIVADNDRAMETAKRFLASQGYEVITSTEQLEGDALQMGISLGKTLLKTRGTAKAEKTAFLAGGETTVKVRGGGSGGRNQEMAMGASISIQGSSGIAGLCAATDGIDGKSPAAGGFFDGYLLDRAKSMDMDHKVYLHNNDSFNFLRRSGYSFVTGPTGTNVMDIAISLIHR